MTPTSRKVTLFFFVITVIVVVCIQLPRIQTLSNSYPLGIQLDVEPHVLGNWASDMQSVANQYLDLIEQVVAITEPSDIPLRVVIPRWYDGDKYHITRNGRTKAFSQLIQDLSNVVVMDYVNSASRAINDALTELQYAIKLHSDGQDGQVVIALETDELPSEPMATFYGQTSEEFEKALIDINSAFSQYKSFESIAIHYLGSWREMNPNCSIPSNAPMRDLYVWDWQIAIDKDKQEDFFMYVAKQQSKNKLRRIYLESAALLDQTSYKEQLELFIDRLNSQEIGLELLSGDPIWSLTENHEEALKFVRNAANFTLNMRPNSNLASNLRHHQVWGIMGVVFCFFTLFITVI